MELQLGGAGRASLERTRFAKSARTSMLLCSHEYLYIYELFLAYVARTECREVEVNDKLVDTERTHQIRKELAS
jgi:hypothetical protein